MHQEDLLKEIKKIIQEEIKSSEERVTLEIRNSQKETIGALSDLIESGYNLHEKRIEKIEDHLDLIPTH